MTKPASTQRKAGVLLSYAYSVAQVLVYLVYVPLLLSGIGRDEYGLYQFVGSAAAYIVSISNILSFGVGRFYSKYFAENDQKNMENTLAISKRLYWALSGIGFLLFGVLAVGVQFAYAGSFSQSQLNECSAMLMVLAANTMVTMNNTINSAAITVNERFIFQRALQLAVLVAQPILVVVLIQFFPNALTVTVAVLVLNIANASIQRIYAQSVLKTRYTYHGWDKELAIGLVKFSGAILLVTIADQIFWNADQLIIGYFYDAGAIAIYAVGAQIYKAYMPIGTAVSGVFFPKVSRLWFQYHDMEAIEDLLIKVGRIAAYVLLLVLSGFSVFGRDFIDLWVGPDYWQAYWIALIVMAPFTIDLIQNLWLTLLQVMNKYLFKGIIYSIIAVCNIFLTIWAIGPFGMLGAAASTGFSFLIGNGIIMNWYYAHVIGIDVGRFWSNILRIFFPVVVLAAVAFLCWTWLDGAIAMTWPVFFIGVGIYLLLYLLVTYRVCMNDYERGLLGRLLPIRKGR